MSPTNVAGRRVSHQCGVNRRFVGPAAMTATVPSTGSSATHPGNSVAPS
jgi:hypothetical protein